MDILEKRSVLWPEAFEAATLPYLNKELGIQLYGLRCDQVVERDHTVTV